MNSRNRLLASMLMVSIAFGAWAGEISVQPGSGTLAAAVAGATDGDTLLLQDGGYSGSVTVNKSLTIRPVNRATSAVVSGPLTIAGAGIRVMLRGLKFSGNNVGLSQAAAIQILENEWLSGDLYCGLYRTSEGDGSLVIVGNRFAAGSDIYPVYSDGAYIAGNTLYGGSIATYSYVWIVGNDVHAAGNAIHTSPGGSAFILGNRLHCDYYGGIDCILAQSAFNLIAGNVVEVNDANGTFASEQPGIRATSSAEATIVNNVVRGSPPNATRTGAAISADSAVARVSGNIVIDWVSNSGTPIAINTFNSQATHNLCFNNTGNCPAGDANLDADPQFVNLVDYQLDAGSPAVDAGPTDVNLADQDRTRNDMGAHGGPWDISQYDVQRAPASVAPYVYPLFKASTYLSGGILEVKALGVARLR